MNDGIRLYGVVLKLMDSLNRTNGCLARVMEATQITDPDAARLLREGEEIMGEAIKQMGMALDDLASKK